MQFHETAYLKKTRFQSRLLKLSLLLFLGLILVFPSIAFAGARNGLLLWWDILLPTLLPFMIISGLIIRLRITRVLSVLLYPIFKHILPISKEGCYPVFIGFLAGYPVGAKTTADLRQQGVLSTKEAQMLCAFTNNASPMFVLSFIATSNLATPKIGLHLLLLLILSSYISSLIWYYFISKKSANCCTTVNATASSSATLYPKFQFEMLDDSILSAFEVVTKVGGYILLFSVLASFINSLPIPSGPVTATITGLLEITTGIHNISILAISLKEKIVLITSITAFGGLSGFAQTKSVLSGTNLSSTHYIICKLISALSAFLFSTLYTAFM